jgi:hypothetical protein
MEETRRYNTQLQDLSHSKAKGLTLLTPTSKKLVGQLQQRQERVIRVLSKRQEEV